MQCTHSRTASLRFGRVAGPATLLLVVALHGAAFCQSSANYKLAEHTFNAGGDPNGGSVLSSASFRIRLDAIGESVIGGPLSSNSFRVAGGSVGVHPPPGEVMGLRFASDGVTLSWDPEQSIGDYNLYRDTLSGLPGLSYGLCEQSAIGTTAAVEGAVPPGGAGYFYLVTARNRLREEGTKGYKSDGMERANPMPCP